MWNEIASLDDAQASGLTQKEFEHIRELLNRDLTCLEVGIFSALYSEHCSYKSTKVHLKTLPSESERVIQGPGENAGVIDIGDGEVVVFKIESHNHPSFIEPFQGAATGVGGILRDVFTMGARPVALMNSLRFGAPGNPHTKHLLSRAVAGIGSYGNCMGIPTIGGELAFHPSYDGNCLVNAFALGVARRERIFLGQASGVGNVVIYVGSKTGRDGIHGATMASEVFADDSQEKRPTVQVGDPFQEKLLLEACLQIMERGLIVGIQDMGAAGLTSSTYEMAGRAGTGVRLHLDRIPQREDGMNPYELMLSESQERMLIIAEPRQASTVIDVFEHWELDAVVVGEVIAGENVELVWHGNIVSSLPAALLTRSVPQYRWPERAPADYKVRQTLAPEEIVVPEDLNEIWLRMLGSANNCSRWQVYSQYDSTVRGNTAVHPGGDAALIRIKRSEDVLQPSTRRSGVEKALAMTLDCNERYCSIDPRQGTALAVAEACRNLAAVGAVPIGISDCLNFGSPERPEGMWQIAESIRGLGEAARAFGVPIVSGNVSLYNETKGAAILPTPVIAMVGLLEDVSLSVDIYFKDPGDVVFVLGVTDKEDLGASEFLAISQGREQGALPRLDYDLEARSANFVRLLIEERLLKSCHDVSSGGIAMALVESCMAPGKPIGVCLQEVGSERTSQATSQAEGFRLLFAESGARYLLSCAPENADRIASLAAEQGLVLSMRGIVGGETIGVEPFASLALKAAHEKWATGLDVFFQ